VQHRAIGRILRHDRKVNSYKIALVRAINDVVLAYPELPHGGRPVAVPLRMIAESWIASYWAFVDPSAPVLQGPRARRDGRLRQDFGFRPQLTALREAWERVHGPSGAAGGWLLVQHLRVARTRATYDPSFLRGYRTTVRSVEKHVPMPLRYAGDGEWTLFGRPTQASTAVAEGAALLPGTDLSERVTTVPPGLWDAFREVSLWVEALAIHEWSLLTERTSGVARGRAYELLTERPDNRLPLDWERNRVMLAMDEGAPFHCPWTGRRLRRDGFQMDHVVPVSVHPFHELWNLIPADPGFNMHRKRDRMPGPDALRTAAPRLAATYAAYATVPDLASALVDDARLRFGVEPRAGDERELVRAVTDLTNAIATLRNVARF